MSSPAHSTPQSARLSDRTVIRISGADRVRFLQGLVTTDIAALGPNDAAWGACLTPQGRWQADFFVLAHPEDDCLLLDCAATQAETLRTQLLRFRLRADVTIDLTGLSVHALWGAATETLAGETLLENALSYRDPRLENAGWRLIDAPPATKANATEQDYALHRLALGLPDGAQDCETGRTLAAEANMDLLGGIAWSKGCYMGQEITARMHYRALVKRRLVPVATTTPLPAPGTPIEQNGVEVGTLRSSQDHLGLAMLKTGLPAAPLLCAGHTLTPRPPAWLAEALQPPVSSNSTPD
ncbi:MAG: folate-binding protein [Acetobacter papayae]